MTKAMPFTEATIRRAVSGARKAGLRVVAIRADGTVIVHDGDGAPPPLPYTPVVGETAPSPSKWEDREA